MSEGGVGAGQLIAGRYELEALVGKGGFAEVWRARHVALNSLVAIKFLHGSSAQSETMRRRFTTEAQVTAQLKSRHAVQVFDFGFTGDEHPFLVMELLEGETLGRRLERLGRLDVVEAARLLGQSARALQRAHQLGIVHRDFKPDNVIIAIDDEGREYAKVVDFGIAKLVGDLEAAIQAPDTPSLEAAPATATFTKTGAVLGTPFYMAPEQVRNAAEVDLRADIWAFGVVTFECLTGRPPFTGSNLFELFDRIRMGTHKKASELEPSIPAAFDTWFEAACAHDPRARIPDAITAWKRLVVALDCGKVDLDPSMAPRRGSAPSRGRVVVHGVEGHDGANANTVEVEAKGAALERRHGSGDEDGPFRRLTFAPALESRQRPPRASDAAVSHTIEDESPQASAPIEKHRATPAPPSKTGRRRTWAVVLLALGPLVALAAWRTRATSEPTPPPPAMASAPGSAAPIAPAPIPVPAPAATLAITPSAPLPLASPTRAPAPPRAAAASAKPRASAGETVATTTAPSQPRSSPADASAPDPGSYR